MLRNAQVSDLDFIFDLIVEGSHDGHFHPDIARLPEVKAGFLMNLKSILSSKKRLDSDTTAYGLILEANKEPVAFLLISAISGNKGNEFWMAAVAREHRGAGHASKLIDDVLERFDRASLAVMARCHPSSEIMFQMLLRRRFDHIETGPEGSRLMQRLGQESLT